MSVVSLRFTCSRNKFIQIYMFILHVSSNAELKTVDSRLPGALLVLGP